MSCATAVYDRLSRYAPLLVHVDEDDPRIYPVRAPAGVTVPYVVYTILDDRPVRHVAGVSGLVESSVQFDIYHTSLLSCETVWEQIRNALDGWRDVNVLPPVRGCQRTSYRTDRFELEDGNDTVLYRISADFTVFYTETPPTLGDGEEE